MFKKILLMTTLANVELKRLAFQVRTDSETLEGPIFLVDQLVGPEFKPPQITSDLHNRRTFTPAVTTQ